MFILDGVPVVDADVDLASTQGVGDRYFPTIETSISVTECRGHVRVLPSFGLLDYYIRLRRKMPLGHPSQELSFSARLDLCRLAAFTEDPSEHVRNDGAIEFWGSSDDVRDCELGAERFGDVTECK